VQRGEEEAERRRERREEGRRDERCARTGTDRE
jgi:hypothetical protein